MERRREEVQLDAASRTGTSARGHPLECLSISISWSRAGAFRDVGAGSSALLHDAAVEGAPEEPEGPRPDLVCLHLCLTLEELAACEGTKKQDL